MKRVYLLISKKNGYYSFWECGNLRQLKNNSWQAGEYAKFPGKEFTYFVQYTDNMTYKECLHVVIKYHYRDGVINIRVE